MNLSQCNPDFVKRLLLKDKGLKTILDLTANPQSLSLQIKVLLLTSYGKGLFLKGKAHRFLRWDKKFFIEMITRMFLTKVHITLLFCLSNFWSDGTYNSKFHIHYCWKVWGQYFFLFFNYSALFYSIQKNCVLLLW